jgi:raffinose/stachyose/melibiose transport system substrate-binding protein
MLKGEGDNIVKTRLATGEMTDLFWYNSGSLLQALNPTETLVDLSDQSFMSNVNGAFIAGVSAGDGVYGAPAQTAMGGGILYNKVIYAELGLEVPMTWDEFMANNAKISAAGYDAVIQTYGDTWTSQLLVLADYHNVAQETTGWADSFTANEAKFADTPAAKRGFDRLAELSNSGYLNRDAATATFSDGVRELALGEGAHYPMLTFAVADISAVEGADLEDVGFFAQPGDSAESNGLTVWLGAALYVPQTTQGARLSAAMQFLDFVVSADGCAAVTAAVGQQGPYFVNSCTDIDPNLSSPIRDMFPYFERAGGTTPALEFLSPVKGPALEQLTVATGTGQYSADEAAALYDEDVKKQAQQLGLEGW